MTPEERNADIVERIVCNECGAPPGEPCRNHPLKGGIHQKRAVLYDGVMAHVAHAMPTSEVAEKTEKPE